MIRRPPRSTRTDTLFPYTTLFRSVLKRRVGQDHCGNWLLCARADRIRLKLQIRVLSSVEICGCIAPQPLALRFPSGRSVLRDEPLRQCTPVGSTEDFHSNLCRNRSFRQGDKMDLNLVIAILCPESLRSAEHTSELQSLMRISYAF